MGLFDNKPIKYMFKRVATFGLIAVLVVIGGCTAINPGVDVKERDWMLEPQYKYGKGGEEETLDDAFAEVAKMAPGFGGMFLDAENENVLYVYMLETAPGEINLERGEISQERVAIEAAIEKVFGREVIPVGGIRVLQGKYSFLQLKEWYDRMWVPLLELPGVVFTDIDEAKNRLAIGMETLGMQSQVESLLAGLGIPLEAVNIEETKPVEFELRNRRRPLVGGLQINFSNWICTLGVIATRQGVQGFVTNSHCTNTQGGVEGTVYHQPSASGTTNRVGLEIADPRYFTGWPCPSGRRCRYSDSAFVRVPHPSGPATSVNKGYIARTNYGSYTWNGISKYRITSELLTGSPLVGTPVTKVGRTTGRTSGTVTRACVSINVLNTNITLLCQNQASYSSAAGDSGSPVFQITNYPFTNDVKIIGIHWGSGGSFSSTGTVGVQRSTELGYIYMCAYPYGC